MREECLRVVTLLGGLERNALTRAIANTLDELAPDDVQVNLLESVGDLPFFNEDIKELGLPLSVVGLGAAIAHADGVVIVSPEYSRSLPGGLKNALDWLCRLPEPPLSGKPVAIQTATSGRLGGINAQRHIRDTLIELNAKVMHNPEIAISHCHAKVDNATGLLCETNARRLVACQLKAFAGFIRRSRNNVTL